MSDHSHHGDDHQHHGGIGVYVLVFLALLFLTGMSFLTYFEVWRDRVDTYAGWMFMMAVSVSKTMLVVLFFMHLKWEANWKYVLTIPSAIMAIFLMLALVPDIGLRMRRYSEERQRFIAIPVEHLSGDHGHDGHSAAEAAPAGAHH